MNIETNHGIDDVRVGDKVAVEIVKGDVQIVRTGVIGTMDVDFINDNRFRLTSTDGFILCGFGECEGENVSIKVLDRRFLTIDDIYAGQTLKITYESGSILIVRVVGVNQYASWITCNFEDTIITLWPKSSHVVSIEKVTDPDE